MQQTWVSDDSGQNKQCVVWIGQLAEEVTDSILFELCLQAGPVKSVHLPRDKVTLRHQGFGFAEFMTVQDSDYAIKIFSGIKLYGKAISLKKAVESKTEIFAGAQVFVGNLSPDVDEKLLLDTFIQFGPISQAPKISKDPVTSASKGFGFVCFDQFDSADKAIQTMNGEFLSNKKIRVCYAYKREKSAETVGSPAERLISKEAKKNGVLATGFSVGSSSTFMGYSIN
eukprot:NODE_110_length_18645_cov_0.794403.p13 type:complete len:227 gc:universal NODE_110_length_18645_cov_0.794403:2992-2312(-)